MSTRRNEASTGAAARHATNAHAPPHGTTHDAQAAHAKTHLLANVVVHSERDELARDVPNADVRQGLRVVERDLPRHCECARGSVGMHRRVCVSKLQEGAVLYNVPCMAPREIMRFVAAAFMAAPVFWSGWW